jgi:hypothetical protein
MLPEGHRARRVPQSRQHLSLHSRCPWPVASVDLSNLRPRHRVPVDEPKPLENQLSLPRRKCLKGYGDLLKCLKCDRAVEGGISGLAPPRAHRCSASVRRPQTRTPSRTQADTHSRYTAKTSVRSTRSRATTDTVANSANTTTQLATTTTLSGTFATGCPLLRRKSPARASGAAGLRAKKNPPWKAGDVAIETTLPPTRATIAVLIAARNAVSAGHTAHDQVSPLRNDSARTSRLVRRGRIRHLPTLRNTHAGRSPAVAQKRAFGG